MRGGVAALAAFASTLSASTQSSHMLVGIYDEGVTLYAATASSFAIFRALHTQVIRLNLHWGGSPLGVAAAPAVQPRPTRTTPRTTGAPYDRSSSSRRRTTCRCCSRSSTRPAGRTAAPARTTRRRSMSDLRSFALAAATRYSGDVDVDRRRAAARRQALGRVERAEQPGLPHAAVQARQREVGRPERDRLREDLRRRSTRECTPRG